MLKGRSDLDKAGRMVAPIAPGPVVGKYLALEPVDRFHQVETKPDVITALHGFEEGILILVNTAPNKSIPGSFASGKAAITPTTASPKIM